MLGDKMKFGRSSSETFPAGWNQGSKFHFGQPDLQVPGRAHVRGQPVPVPPRRQIQRRLRHDARTTTWTSRTSPTTTSRTTSSTTPTTWFYSDRPHPYGVVQAQYFNDNLLGTAHEIKIGFEVNNNSRTYSRRVLRERQRLHWHTSLVYGDGTTSTARMLDDDNRRRPADDFRDRHVPGSVIQRRPGPDYHGTNRIAAYFSDTITMGRFNLNLGLRMDRAKPLYRCVGRRSLWLPTDDWRDLNPKFKNYAAIAGRPSSMPTSSTPSARHPARVPQALHRRRKAL